MLIFLIVLIVILILFIVSKYNHLITLRNDVNASGSIINVQSQRRADLIPNLMEVVKGSSNYEKDTLTAVVNARNKVLESNNLQEKVDTNNELNQTLTHLFSLTESYPDLKANENYRQLQEELVTTENKIAGARSAYTACVADYNTSLHTVPTNIIAKMGNFQEAEYIQFSSKINEAPKIKF